MRACPETIYQLLYAGLLGRRTGKLRIGRVCWKRQQRGVAGPYKIENLRLIHQPPLSSISVRRLAGSPPWRDR